MYVSSNMSLLHIHTHVCLLCVLWSVTFLLILVRRPAGCLGTLEAMSRVLVREEAEEPEVELGRPSRPPSPWLRASTLL